MLKSKKGISLTTMVITVMIMIVIMGTMVYSALDSVKIKKLNNLYSDIRQIDDAVNIYYLKNGKLPIDNTKDELKISKDETTDSFKAKFVLKDGITKVKSNEDFYNPNDYFNNSAVYKFVKLSLLDNISLNYPNNEYIINTQSHTVYNYTGVKLDGKTYNRLPLTYKDTHYNEMHPVRNIRLKQVNGITSVNTVYFAKSAEEINLKDLLIYDYNSNDGKGVPKKTEFVKGSPFNSKVQLDTINGILNVTEDADMTDSTVIIKVTNYDNTKKDYTVKVLLSALDIKTVDDNNVEKINLLKKQTQSSYKFVKNKSNLSYNKGNEKNYKVSSYGALNLSALKVNPISNDDEIAICSCKEDGKDLIFESKEKVGSTKIGVKSKQYGFAEDTIDVNVYDYTLYAGSAGSNENISKLDFYTIGESKNVRLNVIGPEGYNLNSIKVEWDIVNEMSEVVNNSDIVKKEDIPEQNTLIKITPLKIGKTNLRCIFKVDEEIIGVSIIPINVLAGMEVVNKDSFNINDDIVKMNIKDRKKLEIKYSFDDSNIDMSSVSIEQPSLSPSLDKFNFTKIDDYTYSIGYIGEEEVTVEISMKVLINNIEYKDKITLEIKKST